MKFIHAADIHLDSAISSIKNFYGQHSISIAESVQQAFRSLIDLALAENVDFVLIAGDLFDANWKDYSVGLFFIQEIKRLKCPIYYIKGNHDAENRLLKSLPYPDHFHIFDSTKAESIINDQLKVALHGQSYKMYETREDLASNYPSFIPGYCNIGLLHTSGVKNNSEEPYAPFDLDQLMSKNYQYWALGHIHQNQILSKSPYLVYSGVIQGRHIRETGSKGCYLVTVNKQDIQKVEFFELNNLVWEKVFIDLTAVSSEIELKKALLDQLTSLLKLAFGKAIVIRIVFTGVCKLEKGIFSNEEYWRNAFYCWVEELNNKKIYIEKLVDKSEQIDLSAIEGMDSLKQFFMKGFETEKTKQALISTFETEYKEIERKIFNEIYSPIELKISREKFSYNECKEQIQSFIKTKISESL